MIMLNMAKIKSEEQFGNILVTSNSLGAISRSKNFYLAKEFKTSLGVPDYVILSDEDYNTLKLFAKNNPEVKLSGRYAAVVSYISKHEGAKVEDIMSLFQEKRSKIIKSLELLEGWGVIRFIDKDKQAVMIDSSFDFPKINSIAIELKLSSWEKALWQAIRNSGQFASSYVVMPNDKLDLLKKKSELFATNNVNMARIRY